MSLSLKQRINLPYLVAVQHKDFSKILSLYEANKADINAESNDGTTALWLAAAMGYTDIVKLLENLDADIHHCNALGYSPIMIAVNNNHCDTVLQLFELGARVNQVNNEGSSCTFIAAKRGHIDMLRLLRQIGGDIDKPNNEGVSPVLVAIQERHKDAVQMLYRLGADIGVVSRIGFLIFKSHKSVPGTVVDGEFMMEAVREVKRRCEVCQLTSPRSFGCCGRCRRVHFCSKQCQKKVHSKHRKECVKSNHFFL